MDIKVNQTTTIELTQKDIKEIIENFLLSKGHKVDSVSFNIKTEYSDHMDHHGTDVLKGATVKANIIDKKEKL